MSKFQVLPTPVKSKSDKKEYKAIKLENGLTALLISDLQDPTENEISGESTNLNERKAAASMTVGVGGFNDPKEVPGMSHFLEHMVSMGSQKYPNENDFESFIAKSGGFSNAGTMDETTVFYLDCLVKHFEECLDRFAQFFISPLMKKDAIARELESVDSEFQMNAIPSDTIRQEMLMLSLIKPDAPINIFSCGNLKTLKDDITEDKLYEKLHEYRQRHYSAHRMTLAVQAELPIERLQKIVLELFSKVPNNNLPKPDLENSAKGIFDTPEFNKIYYVKPVEEVIKLKLTWTLSALQNKYRNKPLEYMSILLGDEGKGSLLSHFKRQLWATACDTEVETSSFYSIFALNIILTEEGLKHVYDVIDSVFAYLNLVKKVGPQKTFFNELKMLSNNSFTFTSEDAPIDNVKFLSTNMQIYSPEDYISGGILVQEYDQEAIQLIIDNIVPSRVNIMITTKNLPEGLKFDQKEKWIGTEYTSVKIPQNLKTKWATLEPYPDFKIPPPNPYLSNNFTILPESSNHPEFPQKVLNSPKVELWYRQDQKFKLPNAHFHLYLISPASVESARSATSTDVLVNLLLFYIGEEAYPAKVANLEYKLLLGTKGLIIRVSGFQEKIPVLIEVIAKQIKNLKNQVSDEGFKEVKSKVLNFYYNILSKPHSLANEAASKIVTNCWTALDKYNALKDIDYEDMKRFLSDYVKTMFVKVLVQGNVTEKVALDAINKFVDILGYEPLVKDKYPTNTVAKLPLGEKCIKLKSFNETDVNSITLNYYEIGPNTLKESSLLALVLNVIEEPLFDVLRNKEQLGYQVGAGARDTFKILANIVMVYSQATKFTTQHLDNRIEEFLKQTKKILESLTLKDLERVKEDIIKAKTTEDIQLQEEVNRNWTEIVLDDYMFDRIKKQVAIIKNIQLDEMKNWWSKLNRFDGKENFRKLSVQVEGNVPDSAGTREMVKNGNKNDNCPLTWKLANHANDKNKDYFIENINQFRGSLSHYQNE